MPQFTSKPLSWFKVLPQVRQACDEHALWPLGESLKDGQYQPVLAKPDGTLIAGERRLKAAKLVGLESLLVIITEKELSDSQIKIIQLIENLQREELADRDVYVACKELKQLNPDWTNKALMSRLHKDSSMAARIFSVDELIPAAREAFLAGAFNFSKAYAISKGDPQRQHELLAATLSGASRDEIEQQGRQSRNGNAPAVRLARCRIQLASGLSITVSGEEVSLDEVIDALGEAQKEAKKARDQALDVKTFQSVMRDKAKAGS